MLRTVFGIDVAHLEGLPQAYAFYNGDIECINIKNQFLALKSARSALH